MGITQATLSHWMSTLIGGDFNENLGGEAPRHLVSDPANYPACIAAIERYGPSKAAGTEPQAEIRASVEGLCHNLHQALQRQALAYLINGLWIEEQAAEQGIKVTTQEVVQSFKNVNAKEHPSQAALQSFLAGREWSLSDYLYLLRRDRLMAKLGAKREQLARSTIKGHAEAVERAIIELDVEESKKWPRRTSCRPGYVIPLCKQFKGSLAAFESAASPNALLEQMVGSR
jgi:hypothetical protein